MPLDLLIIGLRFVQYSAAMILFGSSLFFLYGNLIPKESYPLDLKWTRSLLLVSAGLLVIASPLQFIVQTANLAGSWPAAFEGETLSAALLQMNFGKASLVRAVLALLALVLLLWCRPGRRTWWIMSGLGSLICASFAWMGHGAATEGGAGWVHLIADILHSLGAAAWIGALVVFWIAARSSATATASKDLARSLTAFSGTGTFIVVLIVGTGLINSVFLAGWSPMRATATLYGQVLLVKLALFLLMLALAAANRFRHAPALARHRDGQPGVELSALKASLAAETGAGLLVLAVVSWLGTLAPVTAQ